MSWKDTIKPIEAESEEPKNTGSSWKDSITPVEVEAEPSKTESLARGAGQGVTLGFGEELGAAAYSAFDKLKGLLGMDSVSAVDEQLREQGFTGDVGGDLYEQLRDEERAEIQAAQEANPASFMAGEIAGAVALPVGELAAASKAGQAVGRSALGQGAMKLASKAGGLEKAVATGMKMAPKAAIESAAYGAGTTEGDLSDRVSGALEAGKAGGIMGLTIPVGAAALAKAGTKTAGKFSKAAIKFTTGIADDKLDDLLKNPEKYGTTARTLDEIAKDLGNRVNNLTQEAVENSRAARAVLGEEPLFKASELTETIKNYAKNLNRAQAPARKSLYAYADDLERAFPEGLSQKQMQEVIDEMTQIAGYNKVAGGKSPVEDAFKKLRGRFSEKLKQSSPEYRMQMAESAKRMDYLSKLSKKLGVKDELIKEYDELGDVIAAEQVSTFRSNDTVANKLKGLVREDKADLKDLLLSDEAKKFLNIDGTFADEVAAREFQKWAEGKGFSTKAITAAKAIMGSAGVSLSMGNPLVAAVLGTAATAPYVAGKVIKNPNLITKANKAANSLTNLVPEVINKTSKGFQGFAATMSAPNVGELREDSGKLMRLNMDRVMDADTDQLRELAEVLQTQGIAGQQFSRVISRAIENKDNKQTILFGLQQQPAFRQMLKKLQEEGSGDGQD